MPAASPTSKRQLVVSLLRFLISKNEYECLEVALSAYTPQLLRAHLPSTTEFAEPPPRNTKVPVLEAVFGSRDEFLPSTVRQSTRVFAGTYFLSAVVDVVLIGIIKKQRCQHSIRQTCSC